MKGAVQGAKDPTTRHRVITAVRDWIAGWTNAWSAMVAMLPAPGRSAVERNFAAAPAGTNIAPSLKLVGEIYHSAQMKITRGEGDEKGKRENNLIATTHQKDAKKQKAATSPVKTSHAFHGRWASTGHHENLHELPCPGFQWKGPSTCEVHTGGESYEGVLQPDGTIRWSDGDVWTRC